jgi:hypothetical protein
MTNTSTRRRRVTPRRKTPAQLKRINCHRFWVSLRSVVLLVIVLFAAPYSSVTWFVFAVLVANVALSVTYLFEWKGWFK